MPERLEAGGMRSLEMLKDEMFQKTGANLEIKKVLVRNTKKSAWESWKDNPDGQLEGKFWKMMKSSWSSN